jgi:DNA-binding transcriptional ArsR family regulator
LHQRVCRALGDPKRLLILYALEDGPLCVNEPTGTLHFNYGWANEA